MSNSASQCGRVNSTKLPWDSFLFKWNIQLLQGIYQASLGKRSETNSVPLRKELGRCTGSSQAVLVIVDDMK